MLQELYSLPDGLLDADARELNELLGAPTLIHLSGERTPALFVSVLMHGNETVGWNGIRALLKDRLVRFGELRLQPVPRGSLRRLHRGPRDRSAAEQQRRGEYPSIDSRLSLHFRGCLLNQWYDRAEHKVEPVARSLSE